MADIKIQWGFGADYTGSRIAFILGPLVSAHVPQIFQVTLTSIDVWTDPNWHPRNLAEKPSPERVCFPHDRCPTHDCRLVRQLPLT